MKRILIIAVLLMAAAVCYAEDSILSGVVPSGLDESEVVAAQVILFGEDGAKYRIDIVRMDTYDAFFYYVNRHDQLQQEELPEGFRLATDWVRTSEHIVDHEE